jgi:Ankyrin repeats (3 copies)
MAFTPDPRWGLTAAIMAYLKAQGNGRCARTVAALREVTEHVDELVVSDNVLLLIFFFPHQVPITCLETAILGYFFKMGTHLRHVYEAFRDEALREEPCDDPKAHMANGKALEKVWTHVRDSLRRRGKERYFDTVASGVLAEVQLYMCVGINTASWRDEATLWTPLIQAAYGSSLEMVQFFVQTGHEINVGARDGRTPLFTAAQVGGEAVVEYLLAQGADKEKAKTNGVTPLWAAAERNNVAVVHFLVAQGADKNTANNDGCTPVFIAAQNGHAEVPRPFKVM